MKKLIKVSALAMILLPMAAMAQPKLIEKVSQKSGEVIIPYEKYVLPNGLTVIITEDHSDPIVHVDVTYHVGSAREVVGKSGFAHFFEHMMFQGSDNVADEEHFKTVSEAGGTLNGTTNRDRTNYFETMPNNQLEKALWLEADRMGFLLDAVTQKKFEVQRATVKNERGQNYDNRPYGLAGETIAKALYPYGHPYSWLTIGYLEDLDRVNVQDLKNFFLRWYGPNNATLTVGGDVNVADVLKLAEKYFAPIPRGPEVKNQFFPAPKLDRDRYVWFEDNVRFPLLFAEYPTVPQFDKDEAALDILADILGGSETSMLYQKLVKNQKAIQANVYNSTAELSGEFTIQILPFPGQTLKDMEIAMRETFKEFETRGVTDDDLKRFKATYEANTISNLAEVDGKVSQLAFYQTYLGNPNQIGKDLNRYAAVTKEDVMRVYNTYVKGKYAAILSIVPKGKAELKASEENFVADKSNYKAPADEYAGMKYNKAKDNFDRSKKPGAGSNPVVSIPAYWTDKFANGIKVIGTTNSEIPQVALQINILGGHRSETKDKAGIAQLLAGMLAESTEKYSTEDMSSALQKLGSSIDISATDDRLVINVSTLTKNIDATLKLVEEKLLHPKFDAEDFERNKNQQLEGIGNQNTQATAIANKVYARLLYSDIMSLPASGTTESVESITLDDLKAYYNKYVAAQLASVVVVGDVNQKAIMPKLAFLKAWKANGTTAAAAPLTNKIEKTRIYLVDKEKAPQSEIRIGYVALPFDATGEYYKAGLMNYVLGGAFNSRINLNLREDKGWTYGARSGFQGNKYPGTFTASAGVIAKATDSSVVEFMKELNNYKNNGIKSEELAFTQSSIGQQEARNYEAYFQKAGFLSRILEYNLDKNYVASRNAILKNMTKAEMDALAKKLLPTDKMTIVVVGDKAAVKPGLEKLGYEIIEVDKEGVKL